jgi:hypothetical protein
METMMTHTAEQKVKYLILAAHARYNDGDAYDLSALSGDEIDAAWAHLVEADEHWDSQNEVRGGEVETGIKCDWSRHYESKSVAAQLPDGSWVGWTYWYGGGKHGEPEGIDWIDEAYDLACIEEEKLVVVRTFTKPEPATASSTGEAS